MDVWWYINFKVIGLILYWLQCNHKKLLKMYIDFCVIVIQPINIGEKERHGMVFTTMDWTKDLNGLWFKLSYSYNRYENMAKVKMVTIRIIEENSFSLTTMKTICNWLHSYYLHFLSFNTITLSLCNQNFYFIVFPH